MPTSGAHLALRRSLGKPHLRVVGVDDGAFSREDPTAPLVAVIVSSPSEVEGVAASRVAVGGTDGTERIETMLRESGHLEGIRAILVDGITVGGFNVLDLTRLHRTLDVPVLSVTRRRPDYARIRSALRTYFPKDWRQRYRRVRAHALFAVPTGAAPVYAAAVGLSREDARRVLARTTVHGFWPEPLRLAHLVAHAIGAAPPGGTPGRSTSGPTLKRRTTRSSRGPVA